MHAKLTWPVIPVLLCVALGATAQNVQLKVATISAGAARLDNGSLVNLGQPLAGFSMSPGGATAVGAGIIPALQEFRTAIPPSVTGPAVLPDGRFRMSLLGQPGVNYVIHASTNLVHWNPVHTNASLTGLIVFEDMNTPAFPYRFYRAEVE
jgi:hypothetical protein